MCGGIGSRDHQLNCTVVLFSCTRQQSCSWYVTGHSGQLGLLSSTGWELSIGQWAVTVMFGCVSKHRPEVALAMHHGLWHIHLQQGCQINALLNALRN